MTGGTPLIRELYEREAPGMYFSSVVAQELLARLSTHVTATTLS
jgi:hypothetical protein